MKLGNLAMCLLLVGGLSASCIREDNSDCYNTYRLALSYLGDGTTEIFPQKINRVDMYVFDENSKCILSSRLSDAEVETQLTTLPPLDEGDYRIVCVGNAYETKVENLDSKDLSAITFAAEDYINGEIVSGNDSLYWSAIDYVIEPYSEYRNETTRTTYFASSHYDVLVEVVNAPDHFGKHPKIELVDVSPLTDFNNNAEGQATTYVMETVHDGVKTTTARNNIMRHTNHRDVYLKVTGEDGTQIAMINFADHLEANKEYIDPTLHECLIPFRIELSSNMDYNYNISITVPEWYMELVRPEFKN